jgi:hypothetical protein
MTNKKDKRTTKELFEYADKALSKLTDEEKDRVRRYLNYKYKKLRKVNPKNTYA